MEAGERVYDLMVRLYEEKFDTTSRGWQIKDYLEAMYDSNLFENAAISILNKKYFFINNSQCRFPNPNSYDDYDHFDGVEFEMGLFSDDSEIRVSEEECLSFIKEAVFLYEKKHPDRKGFLDESFERTTLGR